MITRQDYNQTLNAMLERRNFENMVWYYQKELRKVARGKRATRYFNTAQIRQLKRSGILTNSDITKKKRHRLTSRALQTLEVIV